MCTSLVIKFSCLAESKIYYFAGEIFSCNAKSQQSKLSLQLRVWFKMNFGVIASLIYSLTNNKEYDTIKHLQLTK